LKTNKYILIMKKIGILTFAILLGIATMSCNGNAAEKSNTEKQAASELNSVPAETPEGGEVIVLTEAEFKKLIWDYDASPSEWKFKGNLPAVVDFYAVWCGPCKRVAPIMEKLAKEYKGKINIYKVDTDKNRELSGVFGIRSIPSILFIPKKGQPAMQAGALSEDQYRKQFDEFVLGKKTEDKK